MVPVMSPVLCSSHPLLPEGKWVSNERGERSQEKHYPESIAVKIKLRESSGLIWLFPSWPQAGVVLTKYLIGRGVSWTHTTGGYTLHLMDLVLSFKWEVGVVQTPALSHAGLKSYWFLPLSALVCGPRGEKTIVWCLAIEVMLLDLAAAWETAMVWEARTSLIALFLVVLAYCLVLSRDRWNPYKAW